MPLDEGGLTRKFTLKTKFEKGDLRRSYFRGQRMKELVKKTDSLKKLLGKEAKTLPEMALRFVLSFDEISTAIPGMRRLQHVESNVSISDGRKLSPKLIKELKGHSWERNFYR